MLIRNPLGFYFINIMNTKQSTFPFEFVLPLPGIGNLSGIRFRNSREILFTGDFSPSLLPSRCTFFCTSKFAPETENGIEYDYQMPVTVFCYLLLHSISDLISYNNKEFKEFFEIAGYKSLSDCLCSFVHLSFVFQELIEKPFKQ